MLVLVRGALAGPVEADVVFIVDVSPSVIDLELEKECLIPAAVRGKELFADLVWVEPAPPPVCVYYVPLWCGAGPPAVRLSGRLLEALCPRCH